MVVRKEPLPQARVYDFFCNGAKRFLICYFANTAERRHRQFDKQALIICLCCCILHARPTPISAIIPFPSVLLMGQASVSLGYTKGWSIWFMEAHVDLLIRGFYGWSLSLVFHFLLSFFPSIAERMSDASARRRVYKRSLRLKDTILFPFLCTSVAQRIERSVSPTSTTSLLLLSLRTRFHIPREHFAAILSDVDGPLRYEAAL